MLKVMSDTTPSATRPEPSLLIAVTGGPNSNKTRLLADLVAARRERGLPVDGVLAIAGERQNPQEAADEYRLRILSGGQDLRWAVRNEQHKARYYFEPETERKLRIWADGLLMQPPVPLLVLDEFGKFEAKGVGLMPLWPTLAASAPLIVVIAVRRDLIPEIERQIGRRFDVQVTASDPDALEQLLRACQEFGEWTRLGLFGGAAGGIEMTAGTALHAARVPLGGLAMSSVQAALMVFAGAGLREPGRVVWVPFISAGLKALSPGGSRVRPMVAIVMQGLLFGASVQVFGWNVFGLALGGALIGAWAALQGLLLQYLLLGPDLVRAYDAVVLWLADKWQVTAPGLPWLVGGWALVHALATAGVTLAAWKVKHPPAAVQRLLENEDRPAATAPGAAPGGGSRWRDLARWQFWLPLLLVGAILRGTGQSWESVTLLALRFVAVACVLMALLSLVRPARWADQLRRRGWWGPALAFSGALRRRDRTR